MRTNIVDAGRANNEVGHVEMQPSQSKPDPAGSRHCCSLRLPANSTPPLPQQREGCVRARGSTCFITNPQPRETGRLNYVGMIDLWAKRDAPRKQSLVPRNDWSAQANI
jgi:hypothetical protein